MASRLIAVANVAALILNAPAFAQTPAAPAAAARKPVEEELVFLQNARRLADELRFEEAVVEYQRYLNSGQRPASERAQALFELGFIHLLLGDEPSAQNRATEAIELYPAFKLSPDAPAKQARFLEQVREELRTRTQLELLPRAPDTPPDVIRVRLADPKKQVKTVLLRHGLSVQGPFYASALSCDSEGLCSGMIPPLKSETSYNVWYFVEAQDAHNATLARAHGPLDPVTVTLFRSKAWYKNPWVWGGAAAALLGVSAIIFFASPQPAPAR